MKRCFAIAVLITLLFAFCGISAIASPEAIGDATGKISYCDGYVFVARRSSTVVALKYDITDSLSEPDFYTFSAELKISSDIASYSKMRIGVKVTANGRTDVYKSDNFNIINEAYTVCTFAPQLSWTGSVTKAVMFFENYSEDEMFDVYVSEPTVTRGSKKRIGFDSLTVGAIHTKYNKTDELPFAWRNGAFALQEEYIADELKYAEYAGVSFLAYYPQNNDYYAHFNTETNVKACFILDESTAINTAYFDSENYLKQNGSPVIFLKNPELLKDVEQLYPDATVIPMTDAPQGDISAVYTTLGAEYEEKLWDKYRNVNIVPVSSGIINGKSASATVSHIKKACSVAQNTSNIVLLSGWNDIASGQYFIPTYKSGDASLNIERLRILHYALPGGIQMQINTAVYSDTAAYEPVYTVPDAEDDTDYDGVTALPDITADDSAEDGGNATAAADYTAEDTDASAEPEPTAAADSEVTDEPRDETVESDADGTAVKKKSDAPLALGITIGTAAVATVGSRLFRRLKYAKKSGNNG